MRLAWLSLLALTLAGGASAAGEPEALARCLEESDFPRVARVLDPEGRVVYARVVEQRGGHITRAATLANAPTPLDEVFERANVPTPAAFPVSDDRVCAVVDLPEASLDAETHVLVSTGLNYAAHAEEAGGGDVFLFPKPSAPTPPYGRVHAPAEVALLDYEVELAFVLLAELDPFEPPSRSELLANVAFFVSNDISDREAIVRHAELSGPGTGFVIGKGQRGFMPAGPWMVRGTELFSALEACGGEGLGLRLWVGDEAEPRQSANTTRMILQPEALIARIGSWITERGVRTPMPFYRDGEERFYPLAVGEGSYRLTAGSIVQTGTPEGVAMHAPSPLGVTLRGLLRLRGPFEQFLVEERERFDAGETGYLTPGSRVRAEIDGLGTQWFEIGEAGGQPDRHACEAGG